MKKTPDIILAALILVQGCLGFGDAERVDLSTPEASIRAHYRALTSFDIGLLRKVDAGQRWMDEDAVREVGSRLSGFVILTIQPMRASEMAHDDDMYARVEERYTDGSSAFLNFVLRSADGEWRIISFNVDEETAIDFDIIERQADDALER